MNIWISLALSLMVFGSNVRAETAPVGLAYSGKQCIKYWAGDECIKYKLPDGWKELYPLNECKKKKGAFCYEYNGKECQPSANPAACCQAFGFKFVKKTLESKKIDAYFCKKPEQPKSQKGFKVDSTSP